MRFAISSFFIVEDLVEKAAKDVSSSFIVEDPEKAAKDVSSSMFIAVDTGTGAKDVQLVVFTNYTSREFLNIWLSLGTGLDIFSLGH